MSGNIGRISDCSMAMRIHFDSHRPRITCRMPTRSKNRIALVTGANKGIGFEVVRQLRREGFRVFLGARDEKAGRAAADKLKAEAGRASDTANVEFINIDITDPESVKRAAEEFSKQSDRLDALVNNAGILLDEDKDILRATPEIFDTTLRTNTLGALLVSQAFVPFLKKSDSPRIVNVSSGGGQLTDGADGWAPAYCISKTALNGVTVQLAAALPDFAVNSVCPGWVRTDMGGSNAERSVAEGASGVVWLACEASQSMTGKFFRDRKIIPW
jgi:NAD(P)-dependent dehydrogenase (short-subunit alcohol dehydrogenase family)